MMTKFTTTIFILLTCSMACSKIKNNKNDVNIIPKPFKVLTEI